MKKTQSINLGGKSFTINEDAYALLENYLTSVGKLFAQSEDADETIEGIENKIAGLSEEKYGADNILDHSQVEEIIQTLGYVEMEELDDKGDFLEFADDFYSRTEGKKFRRVEEGKMFGGVCTGIAKYFEIPDVIWVRLAFALFTLGGGAGILIYFVLWIIMAKDTKAA